jgi:hypothetical protein
MKNLIAAAVFALASLSLSQSAFAYISCTTSCVGDTCFTNCY